MRRSSAFRANVIVAFLIQYFCHAQLRNATHFLRKASSFSCQLRKCTSEKENQIINNRTDGNEKGGKDHDPGNFLCLLMSATAIKIRIACKNSRNQMYVRRSHERAKIRKKN
jgi:hypothetical protein